MTIGALHGSTQPSDGAKRDTAVGGIARVVRLADKRDHIRTHRVAGHQTADADLVTDTKIAVPNHGQGDEVLVITVVQRDAVLGAPSRHAGNSPLRGDAVRALLYLP